jgi:hypothetical protein
MNYEVSEDNVILLGSVVGQKEVGHVSCRYCRLWVRLRECKSWFSFLKILTLNMHSVI